MSEQPSLWDSRPRLERSGPLGERYDVVVVGGVGLATAVETAARGASVALLEARHLGAGASGRTTAKVSVLQGTRLSRIARRHDLATAARYLAGNLAGQRWVLERARELGVSVQRPAAVTYAARPEELGAVERETEVCDKLGLPVRWREPGDEPFPFAGGVELDEQAQLDPRELLEALAGHATALGADVRTGVRVTGVHGGTVETTAGAAQAGHVVLATGAPILDRGGFFARLEPVRSYLVALTGAQAPPEMFLSAGSPARSLRRVPRAEGDVLLVGGNGHPTARSDSEAQQVAGLVEWAARWFPGARARERWSAQDHESVDELPVAGPLLPGSDRVLLVTGLAKWGMTSGPAAALLLAARVAGEPLPDWAGAFGSWSAHELAGLGEAVKVNAQNAATLVADRLAITGGAEAESPPAEGGGVVVRDGFSAVAVATLDGRTCAVRGTCTHLGGVVRWNDHERTWDCPLHGSRFAPDGSVLEGPATEPLEPATSPFEEKGADGPAD